MTSRELLERVVRIKRRSSDSYNINDEINGEQDNNAATWHIAGTGMLVSSRHILTCAHVIMDVVDMTIDDIAMADAEENYSQFNPVGQQVYVDFPANPQLAQVQRATIIEYLPDNPARVDGLYDMALLELSEDVTMTPFCLSWQEASEDSPVKLIGFPETAAEVGHWYQGKLGYPTTRNWIYVNGDNGSDKSFWLKGFSGGPVHSVQDGMVVGMASMQDGDTGRFIMIPADVILQAFGKYISSCQLQERRRLRRLKQKKYRSWMIVGLGVFILIGGAMWLRLPVYEEVNARAYTSYKEQNYKQSLHYLNIARFLRPFSAKNYITLASVWEDSGLNRPDKVEKYYLEAIRWCNDRLAKNNLAHFYIKQYDANRKDESLLESAAHLLEQAELQTRASGGLDIADNSNNSLVNTSTTSTTSTTMKVQADELSNNSSNTNMDGNRELLSYIIKNRAWISRLRGNNAKALGESQQAIDLNPNNAEAYCLQALLLEDAGSPALEMWEQCYILGNPLIEQRDGIFRASQKPSVKAEWLEKAADKLFSYE